MSTKCPVCGRPNEDESTTKLKYLIKNMVLVGKLADYALLSTPEKDWHPEVKAFAYNNLIINNK